MSEPRMPSHWKTLLVSVLILNLVTLYVVFRLSDYAIWLHFDGRDTDLVDTMPGKKMALFAGVTVALLFLVNARAFAKAVKPASPEELAKLREGRIPAKDEREAD